MLKAICFLRSYYFQTTKCLLSLLRTKQYFIFSKSITNISVVEKQATFYIKYFSISVSLLFCSSLSFFLAVDKIYKTRKKCEKKDFFSEIQIVEIKSYIFINLFHISFRLVLFFPFFTLANLVRTNEAVKVSLCFFCCSHI